MDSRPSRKLSGRANQAALRPDKTNYTLYLFKLFLHKQYIDGLPTFPKTFGTR